MSLVKLVYSNVLKRTSTFVLGIAGAVFFFERGLDTVADSIFETRNQGKLWKHMESKYMVKEEEEE